MGLAPSKSAIWRDLATVLGFRGLGKFNNFPGVGKFPELGETALLRSVLRMDAADACVSRRRYDVSERKIKLLHQKVKCCSASNFYVYFPSFP